MSKLKNIGYTFVGNVTFSMIKWLILILIVKLTTPEQVGNYTFAMALYAYHFIYQYEVTTKICSRR